MKTTNRILVSLLAGFGLVWSATGAAQDCNAGNQKYHQQAGGVPISCSQSSCHGNDPRANMNGIADKGQIAGNIDAALDSVNDMQGLRSALGLTPQDLDNIALYIWYRAGNSNCPAPTPALSANPTSLSFGSVNVGASSGSQQVTITNTGSATANSLTVPAAPTHFSRTTTCGSSLAAGASCTVTVTFSPTAGGTFSPTLTVTGSGGSSAPIGLSGTGVAASASLQASPASLTFGAVTVGQTSSPQLVTITNTGGGGASGLALSNPNAAEFLVTGNTCGATLAAGASCALNVAYKPASVGSDNNTLAMNYTGGSATVNVTGNGTAPATASLGANPASLAFGNVTAGTSSTPKSLTITNTGGAAAASLSLNNNNPARFAVSGNTCGSSLAAGASCALNVTYSPAAAGSDSGQLTFSYTGGNLTVAMSGTGTAAATANVSVTPTSLSFGNVTVGTTSGAQAVTVNNTGGAAAAGVAVASGSSEFPVSGNTCGATLNAGASCTFNVAYAPNGAGADNATVTVSYTGGSAPVAVSGTGTAAATANLSASPPVAAFGNVTVGQSSSGTTITVNNTGGAAATGVAMSNSNASEFAVSGNTCGATINAGGSCALTVTYTPSGAGGDTATLTFNYAGGSLVVSLTGTGVATQPPPGQGQLSMPSSVMMPDTTLGTSSASQSVTLSNIGSVAVTVSAITSSSAEFAVGSINCGTVNAGAFCSFSVTFTPTAAGARSATITVASNGAGAPQIIAVGGNGVTGGTPPPAGIATAIEYYHQEFDHYFMTSIADEISKLDTGFFKGWTRTGRSFKVSTQKLAGLNVVCRFFSTAFGLKSSHFYTPQVEECAIVKGMATWQFEDEVFTVQYPNLAGECPANTIPVYRMYNEGQGGAPNHRYTTDLAVRAEMLAKGWIPEGEGKIGVIMCSPM